MQSRILVLENFSLDSYFTRERDSRFWSISCIELLFLILVENILVSQNVNISLKQHIYQDKSFKCIISDKTTSVIMWFLNFRVYLCFLLNFVLWKIFLLDTIFLRSWGSRFSKNFELRNSQHSPSQSFRFWEFSFSIKVNYSK